MCINPDSYFVMSFVAAAVCVMLQVTFTSSKIFCDLAVDTVEHTQKGGPVKFSYKKFLSTADYMVQ